MSKFNTSNPAVKRILQEIKEIHEHQSHDFIAEALEDDIFEWHFVIRGPPDSEFEGGIYHGRILLPSEYPFKPPSFMMLSPSGRFQTNTKICLSISSHHPEHWQPSWSVRTALTAMIAFMPTPGQGALGSLEFPKEERRKLAQKSRVEVPKFGSAARQQLITEMHERMLELEASAASSSSSRQAAAAGGAATDTAAPRPPASNGQAPAAPGSIAARPPAASTPTSPNGTPQQHQQQQQQQQQARQVASRSDAGLNLLAVVLIVAIVAILMKKVVVAMQGTIVEF